MRYIVAATLSLLLIGSVTFAQTTRDRAIVLQDAPIMLLPDAARQPLRMAATGTILGAFEEKGDWLRVEFRDPQFGVRIGWVQTRFVRIERSNLQPLDLSVLPPDERQLAPAPGAPPAQAPPPRVSDFRPTPNRGFIDVNIMSLHPLQKSQTFTFTRTLFGETATAAANYAALESGEGLDVGADFLFGQNVGAGGRVTWAKWSGLAGLSIRIPHPTLNNRFGTDTDLADSTYERSEEVFDFYAIYSENRSDWRVAIFGGPTYFRMTHDFVSLINYTQFASPITGANTVNITTQQMEEVKDWTLGFNAGADASWFFTRYVGVGGGLRFNFGTMKLDREPLSAAPAELRVGATTLVGGARFRF